MIDGKTLDGVVLEPDPEIVRAYLRAHPGFLLEEPALLAEMSVPHLEKGSAVSLVEKQVEVLRLRNQGLEARLGDLLRLARENETLGERLQGLALRLLTAEGLEGTLEALRQGLAEDFQVEFLAVGLRRDGEGAQGIADALLADLLALAPGGESVSDLKLPTAQAVQIFGAGGEELGSAALIPLRGQCFAGLILVGSRSPERYGPETGVQILGRLGALACAALDRCLKSRP